MRAANAIACVLVAAGSALPSASSAQMPRYDVPAHCEEIAGIDGTHSNSLYNSCMKMEQQAYDALKARWSALNESIRRHCDEIATVARPGSYSMLASCVGMEESAGSNKETFSY